MPKFPEWIQPMAATLTQERFTGPEWIFERKFDGIRLLAYKRGAKVELFSRNRLPQNIPALARAIAQLPHRDLILDGEIDWHAVTYSPPRERGGGRGGVDAHGSSPPNPLSACGEGEKIASSRAAYHVFDILWLDGRDTMKLPLEERQTLLKKLPLKPPLHRVTALKDSADNDEQPWERAQREGWEGVIAKRRGSIYESRRSPNWLKMKVELSQEFVVGGFTDPQGKRVGLGALLVGYYEYASKSEPPASVGGSASISNPSGSTPSPLGRGPGRGSAALGRVRVRSLATGSSDNLTPKSVPPAVAGGSASADAPADFVFAGKIGTGFNTELLLNLRAQLDKLEIPKPPFTKAVGLPRLRAHWVRPKIVVQVGFIQWTKYNKLRHPRLLGIRHDKSSREVVREHS
ncbi:MAG TPA: hypothetical protein VFX97_18145 [Pyrinomonadaceae bacterium]|nr:hypothetical protein [Pyrinomonadaceae bacterium]